MDQNHPTLVVYSIIYPTKLAKLAVAIVEDFCFTVFEISLLRTYI